MYAGQLREIPMSRLTSLLDPPPHPDGQPDRKSLASFIADLAGEMEEMAEAARMPEVAAMCRGTVFEARRHVLAALDAADSAGRTTL